MFVKITTAFKPYVEGNVHEVNANRGKRFIDDGNAVACEGPATILPGSWQERDANRGAAGPKSADTAAKASAPGRKVKTTTRE